MSQVNDSASGAATGQELGHALKTARTSAGLLQRELAHKVGYSRSRVAGAEAGDYVSRWHIEIHLPGGPPGIEGRPDYAAGSEETPVSG